MFQATQLCWRRRPRQAQPHGVTNTRTDIEPAVTCLIFKYNFPTFFGIVFNFCSVTAQGTFYLSVEWIFFKQTDGDDSGHARAQLTMNM